MWVHSGITPGSYIKANSTKNYPSAILHLIRPMTKLCLSDLFSISLAEFYSSDKLKLNLLSISSFKVSIYSLENWSSLISFTRTKQLSLETKECKVVNEQTKMAEILKEVSQQLILLVVVVAAVQSHCCQATPPQSPCPHPLTEDMAG